MSSKLYTVPGGLGGGSKTKLIHQIFAGVNIAMASEAMGLAAAAGLNTQQAFEELKNSAGDSWMFRNRVPHMLDPSLPPSSAINIIAKDVVGGSPIHSTRQLTGLFFCPPGHHHKDQSGQQISPSTLIYRRATVYDERIGWLGKRR